MIYNNPKTIESEDNVYKLQRTRIFIIKTIK